MDKFQSFLNRIEKGELDPSNDLSENVKQFAKEVNIYTKDGFLTSKQAAIIWLYYLRRLGIQVEIPDSE